MILFLTTYRFHTLLSPSFNLAVSGMLFDMRTAIQSRFSSAKHGHGKPGPMQGTVTGSRSFDKVEGPRPWLLD